MRVFLLHGLARTSVSMGLLGRRLKRAGHEVDHFGYMVMRADLESIAERFAERVRRAHEAGGENGSGPRPYAVVGHSLGNVITRLASPRLPPGFARFVMLAPPNRPPVLARKLAANPLFRAFARDAGEKLGDAAFFRQLPMPQVPSLIIAANGGPQLGWLPFGGEPNDGILRLAETRLEGVPTVDVPGVHTFLMNRREVFRVIGDFLDADRLC